MPGTARPRCYVQLVGAHHIIKIFYGVRNDIDVYAGRLVAVFGQHLRHTAFAHGVGDAHPDVRHADAAVLDGLAGVAVYSQRPAGVFYQNLAFRRQAQLFFILIKYYECRTPAPAGAYDGLTAGCVSESRCAARV